MTFTRSNSHAAKHRTCSSGIGCFSGGEHLKQSHMLTGPTRVATPADPLEGESKVPPVQLHPHSVQLRMEVSNVAAPAALRMANADAPERSRPDEGRAAGRRLKGRGGWL